ncbi:D-alanine--D-alanine ligase family protein [Psychromicrobium lacuslunae]|uniref:D-alanine--D-alanine ligase n=1 Tax=Psychromicrobium lacuslunae TaxID=1618207 RepID=A0A0D4BY53_9MICC|nr:D-alanine--D-alanine ligase family protein [Psychromicrobium lacuslunae]AJT41244.1 D-alanine--D-alanine ligase [Psychromicrobium lacuslunae]
MSGDTRKPRIAVLFGGRSSEHAVSCVTAMSVLSVIDPTKYDVVPIGISKAGQWVLAGQETQQWRIEAGSLPEVNPDAQAITLSRTVTGAELVSNEPGRVPELLGEVDVVFPLLHGPFGEDGTIQGLLELADTRYVGAGVTASAVGMDKEFMKIVLAAAGLNVHPYRVIRDRDWQQSRTEVLRKVAELGWPVFVKPARAGSSIGISKVDGPEQLEAAIEAAREYDPKVMVEAAVRGREIEIGVLQGKDGAGPRTSFPGEVIASAEHSFYDFEAKYLADSGTEVSCPAELPEPVIEQLRDAAVKAFDAIEAEGLSRVDFFYTPEGELVINEINTMPGFTPQSMFPQMWAASGMSYPELVEELIQLALQRKTGLR